MEGGGNDHGRRGEVIMGGWWEEGKLIMGVKGRKEYDESKRKEVVE